MFKEKIENIIVAIIITVYKFLKKNYMLFYFISFVAIMTIAATIENCNKEILLACIKVSIISAVIGRIFDKESFKHYHHRPKK